MIQASQRIARILFRDLGITGWIVRKQLFTTLFDIIIKNFISQSE
jgi:hypothetical protein